MNRPLRRLYLIADVAVDDDGILALERARVALAATSSDDIMVQLRTKHLRGRALVDLARSMLGVCRHHGCPLLINGRSDVALAVGADGVHLPDDGIGIRAARAQLGAHALVGVSLHRPDDATLHAQHGADFVAFGPVWPTASKPGHAGVGIDQLRATVDTSPIPVYALGGLQPGRVGDALNAGAHGVAAIRAFHDAKTAARMASALPQRPHCSTSHMLA